MSTAVYDGVAFRQQEIRERAGLLPDMEVEFELRNNIVTLKKARKGKSRGQKLVERLRGTGRIKMTTDETMRLTRGDE